MAQSPEYPDLLWMPPKSWTVANRTSVQLIVIHDTEGSEGPTSAEDGASYDQRRTDGTSTHYFHDSDSTVQCVRTEDIAHAARVQGNRRGIQHELCGREGQGIAGWADPVSQGTLVRAARQCARDARKWGIPVQHLTVAQVADGEKGFCGHWDVTRAFPQDNGTHTDPGPDFPWTQFLNLVRAELEEDDMPTADEIAKAVWDYRLNIQVDPKAPANLQPAGGILRYTSAEHGRIQSGVNSSNAALSTLAGKDFADENAIVAGVLAGLSPEKIAAAIPAELAEAVADELGSRISRPRA